MKNICCSRFNGYLVAILLFTVCLLIGGSYADTTASGAADVTENALSVLEKANGKLKRFVLENGMICLVKEDNSAPVVSIQVWVGTGSIHEQEYLGAGMSHAVEHMIFKGTDARSVGDITREINDAGGTVNAYTSFDRTVFHTDLPAKNWLVGLDVLADAVMNAAFPENEWKKEKQVILREIAMRKDDPDSALDRLLWQTAYAVHPYKFPVIGHEAIFKTIERADLETFFRRNYVSDNMITVMVGDVDAGLAEKAIRDVFAGLDRRARPPVFIPREPVQIAPRVASKTGAYNVARMAVAYHTAPLTDPDAPLLDLLAQIVGYGRSSRLVEEIKEKRKLAYSIDALSYTPKQPGIFAVSAVFDPEREDDVKAAIEQEIDSWLNADFTPEEMAKGRRMILNEELSDLQTMKGQAGNYAAGEFYAGNPRFSETYLKQLGRVTPEMLRAAAAKYLRPENRTLVVLSPAATNVTEETKIADTAAPEAEKFALTNGVSLIVREDHRLPFVHACVAIRGGLLSENESNSGITKLMSELLTRGTRNRSSHDISLAVETMGGSLSAFSGYSSFGLQMKCLSGDIDEFMDILADCLLNSEFSPDEIAKEKELQLAALDKERERPFFLAQDALCGMLFPGHPYRWSTLGRKEAIETVDRAALREHFEKHILPGAMALSIFGDISSARATALAETYFGKVAAKTQPALEKHAVAPQLPARAKQREPREQAILLAGFPGVDVRDSRYDALAVLEETLSGLSSDLSTAVREERGLAYYVGAYQRTGLDPGAFVVYAGTKEDAVREVEELILQEIQRVISEGLREEEVERAKNQIIAGHEMSLQDNSGLAMTCALNELYGLGYRHAFTTRQRYESITATNVLLAAQSILSTNKLAISVVLPARNEEDMPE